MWQILMIVPVTTQEVPQLLLPPLPRLQLNPLLRHRHRQLQQQNQAVEVSHKYLNYHMQFTRHVPV